MFLMQIFMQLEIPRVLTTDNGKEFKNQLDNELAQQLGIKRIFTTPHHPQVNREHTQLYFTLFLFFTH